MQTENDLQELTKEIRKGTIIPERAGEYWTDEEREDLTQRFYFGEGISEIALQLQRSEMAVVQQLVAMKLLTSPGAGRPRRAKQLQCLCGKCQLDQSKCKQAGRCVRGETYA